MSNRFYVNDVQIFGNNEMFENTYAELEKQGIYVKINRKYIPIEKATGNKIVTPLQVFINQVKQKIKHFIFLQ